MGWLGVGLLVIRRGLLPIRPFLIDGVVVPILKIGVRRGNVGKIS